MSYRCNYEPEFQRECIYVNKVYNECSIVDCPTYRILIPPTCPPAVNIVNCAITDINAAGFITSAGEVDLNVEFVLNVEYDGNGTPQFIQQTAQFRKTGIRLEGAQVGMEVVILPLLRTLNSRAVDGGAAIECEVGVYIVIKAVALVQLEVMGRFCPEPPECEQVSPIGCAEWFEDAESGKFWPPFPPQPVRPGR
ncbi:MAG TPA: hypothetical protein GX528_07345 [Firmicutes bacterium]|nr:hypothetical protein [Bacillota bacterium]